jgi:hypothetical protein
VCARALRMRMSVCPCVCVRAGGRVCYVCVCVCVCEHAHTPSQHGSTEHTQIESDKLGYRASTRERARTLASVPARPTPTTPHHPPHPHLPLVNLSVGITELDSNVALQLILETHRLQQGVRARARMVWE